MTTSLRTTLAMLLFAALACAAGAASADEKNDGSAAEKALADEADRYFSRGTVLFEAGRYAEAAEAFQLAYDTVPAPAVLANIATCLDRADKTVEAVEAYRAYFRAPVDHPRNAAMKKRLAALEQEVAELRVECSKTCTVLVDGVDRGESPVRLVLLPGAHELELSNEGASSQKRRVSLEAGQILHVQIDLPSADEEAAAARPLEPDLATEDGAARLGPGFWTSAGIAAAAAGCAALFGALTLADKNRYEEADRRAPEAKASGERNRAVTNISLAVAGAAAGAAIVFALTGDDEAEGQRKGDLEMSLSPWSLTVGGRF